MANNNNGGEVKGLGKPHVVVVPFVQQGHLIPFLELSKLLASQGVMVSYFTTPSNVARLHPQLDKNFDLDVKLVSILDPSRLEIENYDTISLNLAQKLLAGPFEEWLCRQVNIAENAPVCIISGVFTGWAKEIGEIYGVPTLFFHTAGAIGISVMHSLLEYAPQKKMKEDDEYFEVPNLCFDVMLCRSDLPAHMRDRDPEIEAVEKTVARGFATSMEGRGVIFNTFYELESTGIHNIENLTGRPVWSIGPMLPPMVFKAAGVDLATGGGGGGGVPVTRGKANDISEAACLEWLDCRSPCSVVFVCFGSRADLSKEQIEALACGLEASQQPFIWAIRPVQGLELPEGFQERTKDRGLVIWGWAPQLLILSHRSVGCFLSHCGWNSTLESVSLGVPMITWAMKADQPFNSKLLVERLGIGTELCVDSRGVPDTDDIKRKVIMVLREEEGKIMRMRAQELRVKAKVAIDKGGSSHSNVQSLIEYIRGLHHELLNDPYSKFN